MKTLDARAGLLRRLFRLLQVKFVQKKQRNSAHGNGTAHGKNSVIPQGGTFRDQDFFWLRLVRVMGIGILIAILLLPAWPMTAALAQVKCQTALSNATKSYASGRYDAAITALLPCLQGDRLPKVEKLGGYRLLALCYLAKDNSVAAEKAIMSLLDIEPAYQADPAQDSRQFVDLVRKVRLQQQVELARKAELARQRDKAVKDSLAQIEQKQQEVLKQQAEFARLRESAIKDSLAQIERKRQETSKQQAELARRREMARTDSLAQLQKINDQKEKEQRQLAEKAERERRKQMSPPKSKWPYWALGGVAVVGVGIAGVVAISGGGTETGSLPKPPMKPPIPTGQ